MTTPLAGYLVDEVASLRRTKFSYAAIGNLFKCVSCPHPCSNASENAGERLDFIRVNRTRFEQPSSLRELGDRISEIVRREHVDFWHLVAPPEIKSRLGELLDDDVRRRLSRIGLGDLVAAAADCVSAQSHSPAWYGAGELR